MEVEPSSGFPEEALQHVLSFIETDSDRNSVSLVSKSWYEIERWCRRRVFIGNCYAVSPQILIRRFRDVRSITIKGKHFLADYDALPDGWGAHALPWITELAAAYPALEEISMKRMVVTDEGLELIGKAFGNLRGLVLRRCEGFSTLGLASFAANSSNLRTLDLSESEVDSNGENWLSHFPDSYTSLEFLVVESLQSELDFWSLYRLVDRCRNLHTLRVNHSFPFQKLVSLLHKASDQLRDLGIGLLAKEGDSCEPSCSNLAEALERFREIKSLSGLWEVDTCYLPAVYSVCYGITSLNLVHATNLRCPELVKLLQQCPKLRRLCVLDHIEDDGLEKLAASCKDLEELHLVISDPLEVDSNINLTERGLVAIAVGFPKLHYIRYFSFRMTNAALITLAKHKPNLTHFRMGILEPLIPDYLTHEPFDNGYGVIVEKCKNLKRLTITGLVTDRLLQHIGIHGKKLETLFLSFSGNSDMGFGHILSGCGRLRKLEIRDCPFGDGALLRNAAKLERMRFLSMSSCRVTYGACKELGEKHWRLNVEVINERGPLFSRSDESTVETLYIYRTIAGPRLDMPPFVINTSKKL